jgi:hypothetical protein
MMAVGGKSDEGRLKEKSECNPVACPASELGVETWGEEVRTE